MITRQKHVRKAFWEAHPQLIDHFVAGKRDYPEHIHCLFTEFVEQLYKSGTIGPGLYKRVKL